MIKVFIDPGHGGRDPGAVANGLKEKDLVLTISKHIKEMLSEYEGVEIRLSREDDRFIELTERARMANVWGADFFCSIHLNGGGGDGFESFISQNASTKSIAYQNVIHAAILKEIGVNDRGKKRANHIVTTATKMPATLTETLFIDHAPSAKKLKEPEFLKKAAQGHVNGLVQVFGLKRKEGVQVSKDQTVSNWAKSSWEWATKEGITDGTRPKDLLTREEFITMLHRYGQKK
ncbi:N-acetylmuramoyl-L-alanine amidase [Anaerobacillus sp. MEB173]|uniref:N-acetylmuramoyl-L-alanine amidase n=1 Tax=Anaerobacillus sp. MEB173 TaxID=3383345 RepID=UPI003F8EB5F2